MDDMKAFAWQRKPEIENFFLMLIADFSTNNPFIGEYDLQLQNITSTRLLDWVDHFVIEDSLQIRSLLDHLGFTEQKDEAGILFVPTGTILPRLLLTDSVKTTAPGIALKVDCIAHFLQCNNLTGDIEGAPLSRMRKCMASIAGGVAIYVVERRGSDSLIPGQQEVDQSQYLQALEKWQLLPRWDSNRNLSFESITTCAKELVETMGQNLAAHIVCEGERRYWMSRNYVARVQKMRQDILGLGWANHDHHTFRSSRENFNALIQLFSLLGFQKRERFYAGKEAGWGAQVMENSVAGLSLFLDVDLAADEVAVDFSEQELESRDQLGTVGLWCALHGDSILGAGMHHLAASFLFSDLPTDLTDYNIKFMDPFSDFDYLKQAFSSGQIWAIDSKIVQDLESNNRITAKKADQFLEKGAIGSHMENIQRRDGYKGFNQQNVNVIIKGTDPRTYE